VRRLRHALTLVLLLAACGEQMPRIALVPDNGHTIPYEIKEACVLTEQRCTRCHTIGRVLASLEADRHDWPRLVGRMRRMPSSELGEDEAKTIVTCLDYRNLLVARARGGHPPDAGVAPSPDATPSPDAAAGREAP
jgi:hypothetical protein